MNGSDASNDRLNEVLALLSSMKGVKNAFYLDDKLKAGVDRIERDMAVNGPLAVLNQGVLDCIGRHHVACIVKDKTFRPPPHATVLLMDSDGTVMGRELLPGEEAEEQPGKKILYLGKDFVMYYNGRSGRDAKFVLPPVPFKEIDELPFTSDVVSSSPSTMGDLLIRKTLGLDDDPKLATVLIGFDL